VAKTRRANKAAAPSKPVPVPLPAWLGPLLAVAAACAIHARSITAPFFTDDYAFLDHIHRHGLADIFARDPLGNFYRPVGRQLYFLGLGPPSGDSPLVFHAVNLLLFLAAVALVFVLARRLGGARLGIVAASIVALTYAADVPVLWASGAQDLLAICGALASLILYSQGRRRLAAAPFLLALLSKETVLLTPIVAVLLDRRAHDSWTKTIRAAWPLALSIAVWAIIWIPHVHAVSTQGVDFRPTPIAIASAFVHLVQVTLGLEWQHGAIATAFPPSLPWAALGLAILALLATPAAKPVKTPSANPDRRDLVVTGVVWALAGAVPTILVPTIWSAYFYLFAMCGVALAIAALVGRSTSIAIAVVTLFAWRAHAGRGLEEFSTTHEAFTSQSHVNRFYMLRGMDAVRRYVSDLKTLHPTLPPRSTILFSDVPVFLGLQTADGPLVRWAYQDTSLRSYYLGSFDDAKLERGGPVLIFSSGEGQHLHEHTTDAYRTVAIGLIVGDHLESAHAVLAMNESLVPNDVLTHFLQAWVEWARGDTVAARARLERIGVRAVRGDPAAAARALDKAAAGDTTAALKMLREITRTAALDPAAHAGLSDLLLPHESAANEAAIHAFAAKVLDPANPMAWRRWGLCQAMSRRYEPAQRSFKKYVELAGPAASRDEDVQRWMAMLARVGPGGDIAQRSLRDP
jgi:hypothetical protein